MNITLHYACKNFFYTLIIISLAGCKLNSKKTEFERWTSTDPLAINHRVREQKFLQGNLLANHSFESGKIIEVDSLTHTTKIDGWDLIGKDVYWIHPGTDSIPADSAEVHSGCCSIRISRKNASETEDFGQGVLSNFIRVMPLRILLTSHPESTRVLWPG